MCRLKLTSENYYSREANMDYMSASQFKAFQKCEAAAMAELRGEWNRPDSIALLVGSYVDAYFSGEMDEFRAAHPEMFKKDGSLKAEFIQAQAACDRLASDRLCSLLLTGKNQTIKTRRIGGVWFKGKFDSLVSVNRVKAICKEFPEMEKLFSFGATPLIVDLKYMRDFKDIWDEDLMQKVTFIEKWGYDIQGAIYQAIDNRYAPFLIVGVTKEAEPDIEVFHIPDIDLDAKLREIEQMAPRFAAIKRGEIPARRCGECAYCRRTKVITKPKNYKAVEVE